MIYKLYTDGSCSGNPGAGGIGGVFVHNDTVEIFTYSIPISYTTNNQTELLAAIYGIDYVLKNYSSIRHVQINTDAEYVFNGMTGWLDKWIAKGWKTAGNKPVQNKELWEELSRLCNNIEVDWVWVKAHADNKFNNLADKLAREATANAKQER